VSGRPHAPVVLPLETKREEAVGGGGRFGPPFREWNPCRPACDQSVY